MDHNLVGVHRLSYCQSWLWNHGCDAKAILCIKENKKNKTKQKHYGPCPWSLICIIQSEFEDGQRIGTIQNDWLPLPGSEPTKNPFVNNHPSSQYGSSCCRECQRRPGHKKKKNMLDLLAGCHRSLGILNSCFSVHPIHVRLFSVFYSWTRCCPLFGHTKII